MSDPPLQPRPAADPDRVAGRTVPRLHPRRRPRRTHRRVGPGLHHPLRRLLQPAPVDLPRRSAHPCGGVGRPGTCRGHDRPDPPRRRAVRPGRRPRQGRRHRPGRRPLGDDVHRVYDRAARPTPSAPAAPTSPPCSPPPTCWWRARTWPTGSTSTAPGSARPTRSSSCSRTASRTSWTSCATTPDRVEVTVDPDGRVAVNGWADLDALDTLLADLGRVPRRHSS